MEMFLAVAECGGYTSAGERLHISHSAIHRQVGLLEHEVKDRLLVRVNGRMELTSTGKIVLEHARRIRQEISNLQRQIDDVVQMQTGYLRIGTGTMMLQFFLPRVLARFRQEFPGIDVHIMTGTASEVIEDLKARNLDLGIIFRPDAPPKERDAFSYEPLYREEFVLAVSKVNPLAKRKNVSLAQILAYPVITYSKTSNVRRVFEQLMKKARLEPKTIMELQSEESIEKMVEIDMGVAFLARRRVLSDNNIHYVQIRDEPIFCEVGMILPRVNYIPRVVKEFVKRCRETSSALSTNVSLHAKPLKKVASV